MFFTVSSGLFYLCSRSLFCIRLTTLLVPYETEDLLLNFTFLVSYTCLLSPLPLESLCSTPCLWQDRIKRADTVGMGQWEETKAHRSYMCICWFFLRPVGSVFLIKVKSLYMNLYKKYLYMKVESLTSSRRIRVFFWLRQLILACASKGPRKAGVTRER